MSRHWWQNFCNTILCILEWFKITWFMWNSKPWAVLMCIQSFGSKMRQNWLCQAMEKSSSLSTSTYRASYQSMMIISEHMFRHCKLMYATHNVWGQDIADINFLKRHQPKQSSHTSPLKILRRSFNLHKLYSERYRTPLPRWTYPQTRQLMISCINHLWQLMTTQKLSPSVGHGVLLYCRECLVRSGWTILIQ